MEIWCALVRGLRGDPAADPEILFETRDGGTLQTRDAQRARQGPKILL